MTKSSAIIEYQYQHLYYYHGDIACLPWKQGLAIDTNVALKAS